MSKSDFKVGLDGSSGIGGKGGKDGEPSGPSEEEGKQPAGLARSERSGDVRDLERPASPPPERDLDLPRDFGLFKDEDLGKAVLGGGPQAAASESEPAPPNLNKGFSRNKRAKSNEGHKISQAQGTYPTKFYEPR